MNTNMDKLFGSVMRGEVFAKIDFSVGIVDVRDVAATHIRALQVPRASGRYCTWSDLLSYSDMYEMLRGLRPHISRNLPHLLLPSSLNAFIVAFVYLKFGKGVMDVVAGGLGKYPRFDCTRTTRELGVVFRPIAETVAASADAMDEWKLV